MLVLKCCIYGGDIALFRNENNVFVQWYESFVFLIFRDGAYHVSF